MIADHLVQTSLGCGNRIERADRVAGCANRKVTNINRETKYERCRTSCQCRRLGIEQVEGGVVVGKDRLKISAVVGVEYLRTLVIDLGHLDVVIVDRCRYREPSISRPLNTNEHALCHCRIKT